MKNALLNDKSSVKKIRFRSLLFLADASFLSDYSDPNLKLLIMHWCPQTIENSRESNDKDGEYMSKPPSGHLSYHGRRESLS